MSGQTGSSPVIPPTLPNEKSRFEKIVLWLTALAMIATFISQAEATVTTINKYWYLIEAIIMLSLYTFCTYLQFSRKYRWGRWEAQMSFFGSGIASAMVAVGFFSLPYHPITGLVGAFFADGDGVYSSCLADWKSQRERHK